MSGTAKNHKLNLGKIAKGCEQKSGVCLVASQKRKHKNLWDAS